jgi:uncharacterized HAD superfamily protein
MVPLFSKHAAAKYDIKFSPKDYDHWDYWQKLGMTLEQWLGTIDASHDPALVLTNKPFPGSVAAIRAWAAQGVEIHVVSDRKPVSFDATKQWLAKIGLPEHTLFLAPRFDKLEYVKAHNIDLAIDDKPSFIAACVKAGVPVAALWYKYNAAEIAAGGAAVISATNWPALAAKINARFSFAPPKTA